ncbi:hypothetical protein DB345_12920 [Spartobacteria bacterium LR76]|nr:hypothetical protein DB345_12920 [Spartobacteria bacterium LR76]
MFPIFAGLGLLLGVIGLFFPKAIWWLREGWKFRDAEPSNTALIITRIGSLLATGMAVALLYMFIYVLPRW